MCLTFSSCYATKTVENSAGKTCFSVTHVSFKGPILCTDDFFFKKSNVFVKDQRKCYFPTPHVDKCTEAQFVKKKFFLLKQRANSNVFLKI